MANLDDVVAVLRAAGVTVHETPGWITRGYDGQDLVEIRGILWHHTATNRSAFIKDPNPTTCTLVNGRSDLAGPLCNLQLGRDGSVTIIATGVANHAGKGSAPGFPANTGNHYLIGIEMESSGIAPWDWTPAQLKMAPIVGAALEAHYLKKLPADQRLQLGHMEYSSEGKIDPAGWPGGMDGLRASINAILGAAPVLAPASSVPAKPVPAKPAPAPAPVKKPRTYPDSDIHWVVERGDTLAKIQAYYAGPSVAQIAAYNNIDPNRITPGQKIWIPGPLAWNIEAPDTLRSVAAYYGLDAGYLARLNGLRGPDSTIYIGNQLIIKKG